MTAGRSRRKLLKSRSNPSRTWLRPAVTVAQLLSVDFLTIELVIPNALMTHRRLYRSESTTGRQTVTLKVLR